MADNVIVRVPEQQFIKGEDGYSPEVTIEDIAHGHRITITDRDRPEGQTCNGMEGDSAYEQAVAGGYTGTEAQFNEELASFKELSDETKEAAPFYAEYGVTTKAEIEAAINGKRQIYAYQSLSPYPPIIPYVGKIHYDDEQGSGTGYRFSIIEGTTQIVYDLMSTWVYYTNDLSEPAQRAEAAAAQALIRMNSADTSAQAAAETATTFTEQTVPAAVNTINEAKADALTAVGNAQTTAVGAVQQESATQQAAIQQKGDDVLASIPADYTELSEDVDNLKSATDNLTTAVSTIAPIDLQLISGFYIQTNYEVDTVIPNLNPIASGTFSYCIFELDAGSVVQVQGTGGTKPKVLSFLSENNTLLYQAAPISGNTVRGTYVAPEGTAKVIINAAVNSPRVAKLGVSIKDDKLFNFNDNLIVPGKTDVGWIGNWIRPECVYFKRLREKLYFAFTSHSGAKGIGEYDFSTGLVTKRVLSRIDEADLHNDLAIHINDDGTIVAAYSTGHNTDKNVRIRRSISPECLDYFSDEIVLPCSGTTSYAQLIESSGKLYLFYRSSVLKWAYRVSTDNGITWSSETILITSDAQYYCLFVKTTTDSVIRVLSYTNPGTSPLDTNIRQSFFHTDNNTLYNSDNTTVLGTANISKANITILIANDATLTNQRLLDAAVSPIDTPYVLYAPFSTYSNAVYRLRKGASTYEIAAAGAPLITAEYFLGACFVGTEKICAICGGGANGGTDFVRLYTIGESSVSLDKVIYSEIRTSLAIRNFYPITDSAKAICWLRGIYGSTYTDFNTDAKIYLIDDDKIV